LAAKLFKGDLKKGELLGTVLRRKGRSGRREGCDEALAQSQDRRRSIILLGSWLYMLKLICDAAADLCRRVLWVADLILAEGNGNMIRNEILDRDVGPFHWHELLPSLKVPSTVAFRQSGGSGCSRLMAAHISRQQARE
jgi:hypothetical protein